MPSYRAYSHAIERNLILYDSGLLDKPWQQRKDQSEKGNRLAANALKKTTGGADRRLKAHMSGHKKRIGKRLLGHRG